jgi:hypothetical protein
VLKNKFVLAESNGKAYMNHAVLPPDTLHGLSRAYKISATRLCMENNFSKMLRIPNATLGTTYKKSATVCTQDKSREYKLYAFVAKVTSVELVKAKVYLNLSNWDFDKSIRLPGEDEGWSLILKA